MGLSTSEIEKLVRDAEELYHRLVLVVGPSGAGKTELLLQLHEEQGWPYLNLNLAMSKRMLDLPKRERPLQAAPILKEIVAETGEGTVILDNIEILFGEELQQNPLPLLKGLSRNQTIISSWNGRIDDRGLVYAERGHPEFKHYTRDDIDFLYASVNKEEE